MNTDEAVSYMRWKKEVDQHDYAAASSYLSIRFGESRAETVAAELRNSRSSRGGPTTFCGRLDASRCRCLTRAC